MTTENKPFLRALKLAYKLHKAGLDMAETAQFIGNCRAELERGGSLPPASWPPAQILMASFPWWGSVEGGQYWSAIHARLVAGTC